MGQTVERLCFFYNSDADNCYVYDLVINLPVDFVYETTRNMYFTRTQLNCQTQLGKPCAVHFIMKGNRRLHLLEKTNITGKQVIVQAENSTVYLDSTSRIEVSGRSDEVTGSSTIAGASFIGDGGLCGLTTSTTKSYARHNMVPVYNNALG